MKKYLLFILVLLSSCRQEEQDLSVININPDSQGKFTFNDVYELESVIPLETKDSSLFGEVANIIFIKENLFILSGRKFNRYFYTVFDTTGKFLYRQNKTGRGPGEYTRISNFMSNGDSLIVKSDNKLTYYNIEGKYITEKPSPSSVLVAMEYMPDGCYLINYSITSADTVDGKYYSLKLYSPTGEYIKGFLPIPKAVTEHPFFSEGTTFINNDNRIYFFPLTHNSIFEYRSKDKSLNELYKIKIEGAPEFDIFNVTPAQLEGSNWIRSKSMIWLLDINDKFLTLRINYGTKRKIAIVNREDNKTILIPDEKFNDELNELPVIPINNNKGTLVSIVNSLSIIESQTKNPNSIGSKLKATLTDNSNSVIIVYKMKQKR